MTYVIPPPPTPRIPVAGGEDAHYFPVRRIYCVGKNYADHVQEMGGDPQRDQPCFFTKPADAVVPCDTTSTAGTLKDDDVVAIPYPLATQNLHFEIELAVAIGRSSGDDDAQTTTTTKIPVNEASNYIYGYAVAVDLTRRDLQTAAKKNGLPWDVSKAFDRSAPISNIYPAFAPTSESSIWLQVNGEHRQQAVLGQMIWSVPEIISELSGLFRLEPGDLILTGTPAGVGSINRQDKVVGGIEGLGELSFIVT